MSRTGTENTSVSLIDIEKRRRRTVRSQRLPHDVLPRWSFFLAGFFGPPFFAVVALFVPLLGLLISLLSLFCTVLIFKRIRTISPIVAYLLGTAAAIALCFVVDSLLGPTRRESVLYFIVGGSMFVAVAYALLSACGVWYLSSVAEEAAGSA